MNSPRISVLVPVYKVEAYLQRCIDSVLAQDFTDWEMILVDDGSPDKCPEICDEAAKKDERIRVVHKKNGGLLSARQAGVRVAKGEFLVFWDSDDTVPVNALSILYSHISKGYDVVRATGIRVNRDGEYSDLEPYSFKGEVQSTDEYLRRQFTGDIAPYLWNGIYKANLFDDSIYNTSIENGISYGEDWVTNLIVGMRVKKALVCDDIVYRYYFNPASYTGSSVYSIEYQRRVDKVLMEMGVLMHTAICGMVNNKHCCDLIRSFFVPELGFSLSVYKEVRICVKKIGGIDKLRKSLDMKYLYFIECLPLYYLYTKAFCFLWKSIKLKGRTRKVIH